MSLSGDPVATLLRLPATSLTEIGRALSDGVLHYGFSTQALTPFCGPIAAETNDSLRTLAKNGMSLTTLGLFCASLGRALAERDVVERSVELILTGPEVAGTPVVDTRTTVLPYLTRRPRRSSFPVMFFMRLLNSFGELRTSMTRFLIFE